MISAEHRAQQHTAINNENKPKKTKKFLYAALVLKGGVITSYGVKTTVLLATGPAYVCLIAQFVALGRAIF